MNREQEQALAPKILQLLPADGWRAVYAGDDGKPWTDRLLCWALATNPDRPDEAREAGEVFPWGQQTVVGLVVDSDGDVSPANTTASFIGYASMDDAIESFDEKVAEKRAEMKAKGW